MQNEVPGWSSSWAFDQEEYDGGGEDVWEGQVGVDFLEPGRE